MLQIGSNSDFLKESLSAKDGGQLGMEDLYRNLAIVFLVMREVNGGHPTSAQFALDGVGGERTLHLLETFSHGALQPRWTTDSSRTLQSSGLASTGRQAKNVQLISRMVNCFHRLRSRREKPRKRLNAYGVMI